jgi:uncharacterized protein YecE (DUF72 family)
MKFGQGIYNPQSRSYAFERANFASNDRASKTFLGLPQWRCDEWKGTFYRTDIAMKDYLHQYSKLLNCVEVSSTFYAPVGSETIKKWCDQVSEDFRFLPKWPRSITHDRLLANTKSMIHDFISVMETFDKKLGTTIVQLPPNFSREYNRELFYFLQEIPEEFPVAIEFRHSSWFHDHRVIPKLEDYLSKQKISMVCSDTAAFDKLCHFSFTGPNHVIRYASDENIETDKHRLKQWKKWLSESKPPLNLYFTLHRPDNIYTPELISEFSPEHAEVISDYLVGPQPSLFDL